MVSIASNTNTIDIRSIVSRKEINKGINPALSINSKVSLINPTPSYPRTIESTAADDATVKLSVELQLSNTVQDFKKIKLDINSLLAGVAP